MTHCRSKIIIIAAVVVLLMLLSTASGQKRKNKKVEKTVKLEGRYTRDVHGYEAVIPRKVHSDGTFHTFAIPHFYERRYSGVRRRRYANESDVDDADDRVHYALTFGGTTHHIELVPNHDFMSPGLIAETRSPGGIKESKLRRVRRPQCHYTGWVRGHDGSRAALSVCDGLVGYIRTSNGHFYIEPVKGKSPKDDGRHLHVVYRNDQETAHKLAETSNCNVEGWENAWADRFRNQLREGKSLHSAEASKRSVSKHRFLEVMVVADKTFTEYHKSTDVEQYILTVMNMVSDYYRDGSIGQMMEFVIVRIMYLEKEKEEFDLMISRNGEHTLDSFCVWQHKVNPNITHPSHHDIAVLLTRYDICSSKINNCGLVGLARTATACEPEKSCCITEDKGLTLGVTVAHEVGHVLGCDHDDATSGCEAQAEDKSFHVMSPYVASYTTVWSPCSKKFIADFIDDGLGECLLDEPQDQNFEHPEMPFGAMYDASAQCSLQWGPAVTEPCKTGTDTFCELLWCKTKGTMCESMNDPPADGTSCGTNMWCYATKCVEIGERPGAVDGGWGEYGAWSECSRTCGAGVRSQERFCDNPAPANRGRYCLGKRKNYETCNTTPCGEGAVPFREQQCTEFNSKKILDKTFTWVPFKPPGTFNPCALICSNEEKWFRTLAARVKDGTKCRVGSKDMCISGKCTKVGCDWKVDSDAIEDRCGVCQGDGTQCSLTEGIFDQADGDGYVEIVTVPKGARHIQVEEMKPVGNSLAVSAVPAEDEKFYLNGGNREQADGEYKFGTAIGIYSHPEAEREELEIAGPTSEDLIIYAVLYGDENPGVKYKFIIPVANTSYLPKYDWEFLQWGPCSARCGSGSEVSEASCVETHTGEVSITFCHDTDKPHPKSRVCSVDPCKTRWKTGFWSICETKDGKGTQTRKVTCVRMSPHADEPDIEVEAGECTEPKPNHSQDCEVVEFAPPKREASFCWDGDYDEEEEGLVEEAVPSRKRNKYNCDADEKDRETKGVCQVREADKKKENTTDKPKKEETCNGTGGKNEPTGKKVERGKAVSDRADNLIVLQAAIVPKPKVKNSTNPCPRGTAGQKEAADPGKSLSDQAIEELGDKMPELTLDRKHETVLKGEAAAKDLKEVADAGKKNKNCRKTKREDD